MGVGRLGSKVNRAPLGKEISLAAAMASSLQCPGVFEVEVDVCATAWVGWRTRRAGRVGVWLNSGRR